LIIRAFLFYFIFLLSWKIERQLREKEKRGKHFEFLEETTEEESRLLVNVNHVTGILACERDIYIYYQSHLGHGSEKERRRATCTEIKAMKMPRLLLLLLFFFLVYEYACSMRGDFTLWTLPSFFSCCCGICYCICNCTCMNFKNVFKLKKIN
jgi:hypothetical protein